MELRNYLGVLARRWALIAIALVLAMTGAAGATLLIPPTYRADTQLFVSTQINAGNLSQELFQSSNFSADRVKSYTQLATSPKVLNPVISQLQLRTTPKTLAGQISASVPLDTVLINIAATDRSPEVAAALANAVGTTLAQVIEDLETPGTSQSSPVNATVVSDAVVPAGPVWPNLPLNLAVGLLVGAIVGVGLAVLRESLDTSVKNSEDLARVTDLPVLAAVTRDASGPGEPIVRDDPHSSRSEAYRQLRTNLQFAAVDEKPRVVVVTSAVPAEGKSSVAGNLAMAMAKMGVNVCLVDGDLRRPSVADYFGLVGEAGLTTVLIGRARLEEVLQPVAQSFSAITSGAVPPNPSELLGSERAALLLRELSQRFDMVLVDAPPTLPVADAAVLCAAADGVLLVVHAGKTTRNQVDLAVKNLKQVNARMLGVVLNMVPPKGRRGAYYGYGYTYRPVETIVDPEPPAPAHPNAAALRPSPRPRVDSESEPPSPVGRSGR